MRHKGKGKGKGLDAGQNAPEEVEDFVRVHCSSSSPQPLDAESVRTEERAFNCQVPVWPRRGNEQWFDQHISPPSVGRREVLTNRELPFVAVARHGAGKLVYMGESEMGCGCARLLGLLITSHGVTEARSGLTPCDEWLPHAEPGERGYPRGLHCTLD